MVEGRGLSFDRLWAWKVVGCTRPKRGDCAVVGLGRCLPAAQLPIPELGCSLEISIYLHYPSLPHDTVFYRRHLDSFDLVDFYGISIDLEGRPMA